MEGSVDGKDDDRTCWVRDVLTTRPNLVGFLPEADQGDEMMGTEEHCRSVGVISSRILAKIEPCRGRHRSTRVTHRLQFGEGKILAPRGRASFSESTGLWQLPMGSGDKGKTWRKAQVVKGWQGGGRGRG